MKATDETDSTKKDSSHKYAKSTHVSSAVYGLGFIGAAIYYMQHAPTFLLGVLGFLKAIVWPAFLTYKLLEFLKM